jgi:hypothetical protein
MFVVYRKGQIVAQITAWELVRERTLEGGVGPSSLAVLQLQKLRHITSGAIIPSKRPPAGSKDDLAMNPMRRTCRRDQNPLGPITRMSAILYVEKWRFRLG